MKKYNRYYWLFRKPIRLFKYYIYLKRIHKHNKELNDYDYPELNYYMNYYK